MPFSFDVTNVTFLNAGSGESKLVDIDGQGPTQGCAYLEGPVHIGNESGYTPVDINEFGALSVDQCQNISQKPLPFYSFFAKTYARIKSFLKVDKLLTVELIKSKIIYTDVLMAKTKNFVINHPDKKDKKLVHACLEGPENGVYIRGKTKDNKILLPDYWTNLIDHDTITVSLTPIGSHQDLIVKEVKENYISIQSNCSIPINCFYHIFAERKDISKLETEIDN
jgi:hypothetical protein